jgi:hypothetical protein
MPYTVADVDKHKKGLSDKENEQWVAVANSVLAKCVKDGGEEAACAAKAIQQASGVVKKRQEEQEPGGPETCVCPDCGHEQAKERGVPCRSIECPECGAALVAQVEEEAESMPDNELNEAVANDIPDESFALIPPGGKKDNEVKTVPALRKLPGIPTIDVSEFTGFKETDDGPVATFDATGLGLAYIQVGLELLKGVQVTEQEPEGGEPAEIELAESASGHVISLAEQLQPAGSEQIVPLHLDVALITPGWGNKRDNHYYPRQVVERDAGVFAGVKMFETDHRQDEKSTRTWVSTVKEIVGHTDDGAPIGRVSVHDRNFAERLMALSADDLLEKMECSILASGTARKGEIDGKKGHVVEAITSAESVDWVTRAGAGGRALSLAESDTGGESMADEQTEVIEEQEPAEEAPVEEQLEEVTLQEQQEPEEPPAPAMLEPEKVQELVEATSLPDAAKAKLSEAEYADEDEARAAIAAEVAYVKELTGSGKPFAQGAGSAPEHKPRSAEESDADWNRILTEVGMPYLGGN